MARRSLDAKLSRVAELRHGDIDISTAERMLEGYQTLLDDSLRQVRDLKDEIEFVLPPDREDEEGAAGASVETAVGSSWSLTSS